MPALLAAGLLAIAMQSPPDARPERERTLGEATIGEWEVWASMTIDHAGPQPVIDDIVCDMERDGLKLTTGIVGGLRIMLENSDAFRRSEVRAIGLGDSVWEYRFRPYEPTDQHFADVAYPPPPPPPPPCLGDRIHGRCPIVLENGAPLIRRAPGEPWLALDTLGNEILRSRSLRIGFVDWPEDDAAPMRWAEVPLDGLPEALAWCATAMRSDAARRLNRP